MRLARVRHRGRILDVVVEGDRVEVLDGPLSVTTARSGISYNVSEVDLLAPATPSKVMCVGRNYLGHIEEMGYPVPDRPTLFMKPQGTLLAPGGTVVLPPRTMSTHVQHEAELAIVIGRPTRDAAPADVPSHILGYTIANDVSARDLQRQDGSLIRAKGFDTFCPLGPWIATGLDPAAGLRVRCWVNGELRQDGSTSELVFDVGHLVSYLSRFTTLEPGDVVLTGSPAGSGDLVDGDEVTIEIEGIGTLRHQVAAHPADLPD